MYKTNYENIPAELKKLKQWVCHSKDGKQPINPKTGNFASVSDSSTWDTFEQAILGINKFNCGGIGFVILPPYIGIDIDNCTDDKNLVEEFYGTVNSYTEFSKSGNGLHIICKGSLPEKGRKKGNVEMYDGGRYFITTGNIYKNVKPINEVTEAIHKLHKKYIANDVSQTYKSNDNFYLEFKTFTDDELLKKAKYSNKFSDLYNGNW